METLVRNPYLLGLAMLPLLWACAWLGAVVVARRLSADSTLREELGVVLTATLTLLGLIIGFSFSMALSRYDQRKNYEEAEANAIGTAYLRADFLPAADADATRELFREYLQQRLRFYVTRDAAQLRQIDASTAQLQRALWERARAAAAAQPTPVMALVVAGTNDVINSQGYTQAAWWYRLPLEAWALMMLIAAISNLMLGATSQHLRARAPLLFALPVVISLAFFLMADIDSPRRGLIHVVPQNLAALAATLR